MPKQAIVDYPGMPVPDGLLSISPQIQSGRDLSVIIIGDNKGLVYLADLIKYMADLDIKHKKMPSGTRAHIHLSPGSQLIEHSCYVEICRADAKDTGCLPEYFEVERKRPKRKKKL